MMSLATNRSIDFIFLNDLNKNDIFLFNMSHSKPSLYDILGVNKSDSCNDIKKAYFRLARTHHPDKGGDPEKFKELVRASEILTDESKRKMYDEFGVIEGENGGAPEGMNAFQGGGFQFPFDININDLFGGMFGNQHPNQRGNIRKGRKSPPTTQTIGITLEQFYFGHHFDININRQSFCNACQHTGAKTKEVCKKCSGRGVVTQIVQMGPMAMQTTGPCLECQGKGERILEICQPCSGSGFIVEKRALTVKIPPGTRSGEMYLFPEVCSDHPGFEKPGDAQIVIVEDGNDPTYKFLKRTGDHFEDLETVISLSLSESLIGCTIRIDGHPGYDQGLFVKLPAGSFQGDKYCLSGFGMPIPGSIGKYGDLFLLIEVTIKPMERKLFTSKGRELLTSLFEDKVRTYECQQDDIKTEVFLYK
jgi:DnaJ-class molecular chaperone